jgi:predicted trehalose synthase
MESLEVMNPRAGMILSQLSAWVDAAEAAFLQGYFATSSYDKSTNFHLWLSVFKWNRLFAEIVRDATERPQDLTISVPDALRLLQSHMDLVKALD